MAVLPKEYTTGKFDPSGDSDSVVPPGRYGAKIIKSELKQNSSKTGFMLILKVMITDGDYKGAQITERLNIVNQSKDAETIAARKLDTICAACGLSRRPADSNALHDKPFVIETVNKMGKEWTDNDGNVREGREFSEVKKYIAKQSSSPKVAQKVVDEVEEATEETKETIDDEIPF